MHPLRQIIPIIVLIIEGVVVASLTAGADPGLGNSDSRPPEPTAELDGSNAPPMPPGGFGDGQRPPEPPGRVGRGQRPPKPPGGFGHGTNRPAMPPGGFGHGRGRESGDISSSRPGRGSSQGRGGRPGGGDPSDASQYSGVKTVSGTKTDLGSVTLTSADTKNTAPLYVKDSGKATVTGGMLSSSVSGANAVLVIGKGSEADVSNVTITTTQNSSRGLYAFQGGVIRAKNVRISTRGMHCAAMATDRGEGTVIVEGGVLNTAGEGSPCIYSTGDLRAAKVTGRATGSEAMVIEGRNSILLTDSNLIGDRKCGAMLYQSFSGDAREGIAKLTMRGSQLTAATGPLFFITNTRAEIVLEGCTLAGAAGQPLLSATAGRWGRSGQNGGKVTLRATNQKLTGTIEADAISDVTLEFGEGTVFTGAINSAGTARSVTLKLAKGASVTLTADSKVSTLVNADASGKNIVRDGHVLTVAN